MPKLSTKKIEWNSPEYQQLAKLRSKLFREPFGLTYSAEELDTEQSDIHLAIFSPDEPIGFLSLRRVSEDSCQLRQMVVEPAWQGKGIGRKLVEYSERTAEADGYRSIILDAREESIGFYLKLGYQCEGDRFFFKTVNHQRMMKRL